MSGASGLKSRRVQSALFVEKIVHVFLIVLALQTVYPDLPFRLATARVLHVSALFWSEECEPSEAMSCPAGTICSPGLEGYTCGKLNSG